MPAAHDRGQCFFLWAAFFAFFALLALVQPVMAMGVAWWICMPFCAVISVGMVRLAGVLCLTVTRRCLPWRVMVFLVKGVVGEGAEVDVGGERRVRALGDGEFEARDGLVGDGVEGAAGDAVLVDEGFAVQVDRDPIALEYHHEFRELSAAVLNPSSAATPKLVASMLYKGNVLGTGSPCVFKSRVIVPI
jgi:hypothetical protein